MLYIDRKTWNIYFLQQLAAFFLQRDDNFNKEKQNQDDDYFIKFYEFEVKPTTWSKGWEFYPI